MENPVKNHDSFGMRSMRKYKIFVVLAAVMITSYLTANLMAVKLIRIFGLTLFDAGTVTFPISYLLGDVVTEVYGFKNARRLIFLTFFCNLFLVASTSIGLILPAPDFMGEMNDAYAAVFTQVPRILLASIVAFLAGELLNAWTMEWIKKRTKGELLWIRTIGSSAFGYLVDTVLFVIIAFAGVTPVRDLLTMVVAQYLMKMGIESLGATPLAYALIRWINRGESKETGGSGMLREGKTAG